jgi:uncharacterized membrane protein
VVAALAVAATYLIASDQVETGPRWLPLAVVLLLWLPSLAARLRGRHRLARALALVLLVAMTALVALSAFYLVTTLPGGTTSAGSLLLDAALIWLANVFVFALWYWEVDAGGPTARHHHGYRSVDFIFPQATLGRGDDWSPEFVDYLFLAFNTSTAFSPTDTLVLSHRAKLLMMAQSLVSLVVVVVLAARAINTFEIAPRGRGGAP